MTNLNFPKIRLYSTIIVTLSIWLLLLWNYTHGGVPSHHILADESLPSISNWWGGLLLPLLTWFLLYRIEVRLSRIIAGGANQADLLKKMVVGFAGALCFGIVLSIFFSTGYPDICGYMMLALLPIGLFLPIYRAECLLGFVIGMTYTFGAILPTGIGTLLVLAGVILYGGIRAGILYGLKKLKGS